MSERERAFRISRVDEDGRVVFGREPRLAYDHGKEVEALRGRGQAQRAGDAEAARTHAVNVEFRAVSNTSSSPVVFTAKPIQVQPEATGCDDLVRQLERKVNEYRRRMAVIERIKAIRTAYLKWANATLRIAEYQASLDKASGTIGTIQTLRKAHFYFLSGMWETVGAQLNNVMGSFVPRVTLSSIGFLGSLDTEKQVIGALGRMIGNVEQAKKIGLTCTYVGGYMGFAMSAAQWGSEFDASIWQIVDNLMDARMKLKVFELELQTADAAYKRDVAPYLGENITESEMRNLWQETERLRAEIAQKCGPARSSQFQALPSAGLPLGWSGFARPGMPAELWHETAPGSFLP
jgi:hypothetical protein